jgi:hypothetical protein
LLCETELIPTTASTTSNRPREWVDGHYHRTPPQRYHDLSPAEYELIHYGQHPPLTD